MNLKENYPMNNQATPLSSLINALILENLRVNVRLPHRAYLPVSEVSADALYAELDRRFPTEAPVVPEVRKEWDTDERRAWFSSLKAGSPLEMLRSDGTWEPATFRWHSKMPDGALCAGIDTADGRYGSVHLSVLRPVRALAEYTLDELETKASKKFQFGDDRVLAVCAIARQLEAACATKDAEITKMSAALAERGREHRAMLEAGAAKDAEIARLVEDRRHRLAEIGAMRAEIRGHRAAGYEEKIADLRAALEAERGKVSPWWDRVHKALGAREHEPCYEAASRVVRERNEAEAHALTLPASALERHPLPWKRLGGVIIDAHGMRIAAADGGHSLAKDQALETIVAAANGTVG